MSLEEFIKDQKALLDEFARTYTDGRKRGTYQTMFHPEHEWLDLLEEFLTVQYQRGIENAEFSEQIEETEINDDEQEEPKAA